MANLQAVGIAMPLGVHPKVKVSLKPMVHNCRSLEVCDSLIRAVAYRSIAETRERAKWQRSKCPFISAQQKSHVQQERVLTLEVHIWRERYKDWYESG